MFSVDIHKLPQFLLTEKQSCEHNFATKSNSNGNTKNFYFTSEFFHNRSVLRQATTGSVRHCMNYVIIIESASAKSTLFNYLHQGEHSEHWRRLGDWPFCPSFCRSFCVHDDS